MARSEHDWLDEYRREWLAVAASMQQVTEYHDEEIPNDLSDGSITLYVSELVRDHEELTSRIEAVLALAPYTQDDGTNFLLMEEVHHLLRGGKRIPDTIEEITGP